MKTSLWLSMIIALSLTGPAVAQVPSAAADRTPLKIIQTVAPRFPLRLQNTRVMDGEAWVVVKVDLEGRLVDWLVTGYTRSEFADTAVEALKEWQYEPATLRGEKWPTVREIHFNFSRTGVIISQSGAEVLENYLEAIMPSRKGFRVLQLRELDRIPVPSKVVSPFYPEDLVSKDVKGSVTVEFYIDATGQVRMPGALKWSYEALVSLALDAVKQWQFEPPLHDGQPVLVVVRQEFNFRPKS